MAPSGLFLSLDGDSGHNRCPVVTMSSRGRKVRLKHNQAQVQLILLFSGGGEEEGIHRVLMQERRMASSHTLPAASERLFLQVLLSIQTRTAEFPSIKNARDLVSLPSSISGHTNCSNSHLNERVFGVYVPLILYVLLYFGNAIILPWFASAV